MTNFVSTTDGKGGFIGYTPSLLSPAALALEVIRCRDEKLPWFYYRDILCTAIEAGLITLGSNAHEVGNPFWFKPFAGNIMLLPPMQAILDRQAAHDAPKVVQQKA